MNRNMLAGILGILFAVVFVFAFLTAGDAPSGDEDTDAEVIAYFEDSGNQNMLLTSAYLLVLSALAFVAFVVLGVAPRAQGGVAGLGALVVPGAILVAGSIFVGAMGIGSVAGGAIFQDAPIDAGVARFFLHLGYGSVLIAGGLAAAMTIAAASAGLWRTETLPHWLAIFGFLCAIVLLFAVMFLPLIALPLWALVVGVVLIWKRQTLAAVD